MQNEEEVRTYTTLIANKTASEEAAMMAGLSETGKRVLDYYLERMQLESTVHRLKEIANEKEQQLQQMLHIIHSDRCIRKSIMSYFDEELIDRPNACCSACGFSLPNWIVLTEMQSYNSQPQT